MTKKLYMLRSDGHYLAYLSFDGTCAMFEKDPAKGYTFDKEQREKFKAEYPHVTARWVLQASELKRHTAMVADAIKEG